MFFFSELFERGKCLVPQLSKVIAEHRDAFGIQFIDPARAFSAVTHKARIFQDTQVLRNGRARNWQACRKLVHCLRMVAQHLENGQPGWVAQRCQSILYVSIHLR